MLGITCEGGASRTVYSCGILDRFDSVLFVAPYLYFYIAIVLPNQI